MTKQPVVGTIIIGILVILQGLWALALALDLALVRDINPTTVLIATLLGLAVLLIIIALWPRPSKRESTRETIQFSPVSLDQAEAGMTAKKQDIVADLRWLDSSEAVTVPIITQARATILADPARLAIRTSSPDVDIDTSLAMTWAGRSGSQNIYLGPGLTDPAQAHLTVDVAAAALTVRPH